MITVNGPDGSVFNFPDGTSEGTINQLLTERYAPQAEESLQGSATALGTGLGRGASFLAGFPADVADLASRGYDALTGKATNEMVGPAVKPFGSENIKKTIESYTGKFPEPKTGIEKTIQTVAEFAPAALLGPGGIGRRVATQVVAPGLASEAAGQLTEGTPYEPVARVAGALTGAVGASKAANALGKPKVAPVPSIDDVGAAKSALYESQAIKDVRLAPAQVGQVMDRITANLKSEYLDAPATYRILDAAKKPMNGPEFSLRDMDNIRRRLNEVAATAAGSEAEAARRAVRFMTNVEPHWGKIPGAVVRGDITRAAANLHAARALAAAEFRHKKVSDVLEKAINNAVATHSGGNLENEIYKQVRSLLNNPQKHLRGWSKEEIEELKSVLPGVGRAALRRAAKLFGGGGGLGQLASGGAGAAMFGPAGLVALPAIGLAANKLGSSIAHSKMTGLQESLRARTPLYGQANQAQRQALLSGGILAGLPHKEQLAISSLIASQQARY